MSKKKNSSAAIDVDSLDVDAVDVGAVTADGTIDVDAGDEITPAPPRPSLGRRTRHDPPPAETWDITQASSAPSQDLEDDELANPSVSVVDLFRRYNAKHFWGSLNGTFVEFSTRMTSCAGTCTFRGRAGGCRIALSEPLLKFRPRSDLLSTLLHEMIHAYLFLTKGVMQRDGPDGHGPIFLSHAARINLAERGRVNITPYHTFRDEVALYQTHHWVCRRCGKLVKRAMNRAPHPRDGWWPRHAAACGGEFVKVREPEKKKKWKRPKKFHGVAAIDPNDKSAPKPPPGVMRTQRVEDILGLQSKPKTVPCPVCGEQVAERDVNQHLDECLAPGISATGQGMMGRNLTTRRGDLRHAGVGTPGAGPSRAGPSAGRRLGDLRDGGVGSSGAGPAHAGPSAGRRLGGRRLSDLRDSGEELSGSVPKGPARDGSTSSGRRSGDLRNYFAIRSATGTARAGPSGVGSSRHDPVGAGSSGARPSRSSTSRNVPSSSRADSSSGKPGK